MIHFIPRGATIPHQESAECPCQPTHGMAPYRVYTGQPMSPDILQHHPMPPRGQCRVCKQTRNVTDAGWIRRHKVRLQGYCPGSHTLPDYPDEADMNEG